MLNQQPPEKRAARNAPLQVHSIFYTIQGEGPFCGTPAVFIRLAGCNLQCPACDTDYTSTRTNMAVDLIVDEVRMAHFMTESVAEYGEEQTTSLYRGLVVITGGEPFRQNLHDLLVALVAAGHYVQIESNGTLPPTHGISFNTSTDDRAGVYVVCSPKTGTIHTRILDVACCLKYVMAADSVGCEGLPLRALQHPASPYLDRPPLGWPHPIYLQPMDSQDVEQNARNRAVCVASCLKHGYILQLQVHKLLGME